MICLLALWPRPARAVEKWFYFPTNLLVDKNVDQLEAIWQRAAAAGYTHVLLADSKFNRLGDMDARYFRNVERLKSIAAKLNIEIVPALFPIGYSNDMLSHDPNLVEGPPVKDVPLVVQGGVARLDDPEAPTLPGGDFSDLKKWSWKDEMVVLDQGAARITDAGGKNARLAQKLQLKPWRQYHVSVQIKTQDFHGEPKIEALPAKAGAPSLQWTNLGVSPTQDWKTHDVVFNSLEYPDVTFYLGVWGAGAGSLWWRDAKIEEVAFLNMTRRPGTPLVVKTADGQALVEGRDFEPLSDPLMGRKPWPGEYDTWHEPPQLRTKLPDGTKLLASYSHAVTIYEHQATICLSEPKTYELLRDQARRMQTAWNAKSYMMSHDEMRVADWCDACQARHLTTGQLLADNMSALREDHPRGRSSRAPLRLERHVRPEPQCRARSLLPGQRSAHRLLGRSAQGSDDHAVELRTTSEEPPVFRGPRPRADHCRLLRRRAGENPRLAHRGQGRAPKRAGGDVHDVAERLQPARKIQRADRRSLALNPHHFARG